MAEHRAAEHGARRAAKDGTIRVHISAAAQTESLPRKVAAIEAQLNGMLSAEHVATKRGTAKRVPAMRAAAERVEAERVAAECEREYVAAERDTGGHTGSPGVHGAAEHGAAKPVYMPMTCHCNVRVRVWVAYKGNPTNVGRVFGRSRKLRGQQCSYFEWIGNLDAKVGINYRGAAGHEAAVAKAQAGLQATRPTQPHPGTT